MPPVPIRVPGRFHTERAPARGIHLTPSFTVSSFATGTIPATPMTALTPSGRIGRPSPYSGAATGDFRKVSLGYLVSLFRPSPRLTTYVRIQLG